ncbi:MAG: two pore domain potassium channel family protein [Woeseiaceae bacterium]|nr:two pore domain potassium channel family protein [Woeseiaceae bacterium]
MRRAHESAVTRYLKSVVKETYLAHFAALLLMLWIISATAIYFAEKQSSEPVLASIGEALYWGIAAFSTAGIADTPSAPLAQLLGGVWIVIGSAIFFGIIIATITGYFLRPIQHPFHRLINLIEYNLEHMEELSIEELDLLRNTTDALIDHMERLKEESPD